MKELRPSIHKNLPPLKLYLEDIEFLVKRLESISGTITIKTQTHEFENITEFSEITKDPLRTLEVRSRNPFLSVVLGKSSAYLYLSEDLPEARGVLEQIDSYLRKRRKTFTSVLVSPVGWLVWIALVVITPVLIAGLCPPRFQVLGLLGWISLASLFYLFGFFLYRQRYTIVIPKRRSEAPSFWERNWEKIIIAILVGLLGFFLGWLSRFLPGPK